MHLRKALVKCPEYILIVLLILGGYTPPFQINPVFAIVILVLIFQIVFRMRFTGIVLASIYFLGTLYFLGALISEFNEFPEFNSSAQELLFVGLLLWLLNLVNSGIMLYHYTHSSSKNMNTSAFISPSA